MKPGLQIYHSLFKVSPEWDGILGHTPYACHAAKADKTLEQARISRCFPVWKVSPMDDAQFYSSHTTGQEIYLYIYIYMYIQHFSGPTSAWFFSSSRRGPRLRSFNFERLFTNIDQADLKEKLGWLIDIVFEAHAGYAQLREDLSTWILKNHTWYTTLLDQSIVDNSIERACPPSEVLPGQSLKWSCISCISGQGSSSNALC